MDGGRGSASIQMDASASSRNNRAAVLTFQLINGGLVTLGGYAFFDFAVNTLGNALGFVHLLVGVVALFVGIWSLARKELPRRLLIGVNVVVIAYSTAAEAAVEVYALLPVDAAFDSVIGTSAALAMAALTIYFLMKQ